MCYAWLHRKKMNALDRDSKNYIGSKFSFLIERGYTLKYYFKNGEEEFYYSNDVMSVELFYSDAGEVACSVSGVYPRKTRNIRQLLDEDLRLSYEKKTPIEKINFLAEFLEQTIDELEQDEE